MDLFIHSLPRLVAKRLLKATTAQVAEVDKRVPSHLPSRLNPRLIRLTLPRDLRAGLEAKGFKTSLGDDDAGLVSLMWSRAGGFYLGE